MSEDGGSGKRFLDPIDRVSEVLFGLIMVLSFTGSLSVAEAGRAEVRDMLIGALGCNLAWGLIDGFFYLMGCFAERGRGLIAFRALRKETDPHKARQLIAGALPPLIATLVKPAELDSLHQRLKEAPEPPDPLRLPKDDLLGALAVFVIVFLSTLPVVVPFTFMKDVTLALRVSNGIAMLMLFLAGYLYGQTTGRPPVRVGIVMIVLGGIMVGITIALGG